MGSAWLLNAGRRHGLRRLTDVHLLTSFLAASLGEIGVLSLMEID
jgi:hypothetical protein